MRMLLICSTLILSFAAMAETIVLTDTYVPSNPRSYQSPDISTKFFMDTNTGIGYADISVTVTEYPIRRHPRRIGCGPRGRGRVGGPVRRGPRGRYGRTRRPVRRCRTAPVAIPRVITLFTERVEIPNLNLIGKDMIYNGPAGEVNCGTLGRSRILRTPTLYLTGNCNFNARMNRNNLTVTFTAR